MKWNYQCPRCGEWRLIEWDDRDKQHKCHRSGQAYTPPTPQQQPIAYVDTHNWPDEMEDAVVDLKGDICNAPGCQTKYQTLDHHVPHSKSGRTSVENLNPMCKKHNQEKSDKSPKKWNFDFLMDEILKSKKVRRA